MNDGSKQTEKEREVLQLFSKIRELDEDIYLAMTENPADAQHLEAVGLRCKRWGVDPKTGRRVCLKWVPNG